MAKAAKRLPGRAFDGDLTRAYDRPMRYLLLALVLASCGGAPTVEDCRAEYTECIASASEEWMEKHPNLGVDPNDPEWRAAAEACSNADAACKAEIK